VFAGDHFETDVAGASDTGLDAVRVCYPGGPDLDPDADATVDREKRVRRSPSIVGPL
jgi:putative hydrolase of the HAD superfamily